MHSQILEIAFCAIIEVRGKISGLGFMRGVMTVLIEADIELIGCVPSVNQIVFKAFCGMDDICGLAGSPQCAQSDISLVVCDV